MMPDVPQLFDMQLRQQRLARAQRLGDWPTFLHKLMLDNIADRIACVARTFSSAQFIGDMRATDWPGLARAQQLMTPSLEEKFLLPETEPEIEADLVVCAGLLHASNDVPGLLMQMRQLLQPDGLMVSCFLGGDTLHELRDCLLAAEAEITGGAALRVHPMIDVRDGGALLQRAGFAMPVADVDRLTVTYAHPLALVQDLRKLGETSVLVGRPRHFLRRDVLARMCELYVQKFSTDSGRVVATFSLITVSGWSPAASQPQPKKRGSATVSLAKVLKQGL
jgi:NADH dehydrogenase [ubiquinone] 1 alpha subcomplex assembly factor 5